MDASAVLELLNGPRLVIRGRPVAVPDGGMRPLVYLALQPGPVPRARAAGTLWPEGHDARARGNLRSALWRLRGAGIAVVTSDQGRLALRDDVLVDLDVVNAWAGQVIAGRVGPAELTVPDHAFEALNLLTGWYDDWIIMQRERVRQRLLYALEILSARLAADGRHFEAVEVALSAVHADPLRETAQQALVAAHLANGNRAEAQRAQRAYAELLRTELGLEPGDLVPGRRTR